MHAASRSTQFLLFAAALARSDIALAQLDHNNQWRGVSHTGWNDRKPRVPRNGESFVIRLQPFRSEILGAHITGDQATELIAEMSLARRLEATSEEIICTMHAHPTMHEAVREAALASEGRVVNS